MTNQVISSINEIESESVEYIKPQPGGQSIYLSRSEFEVLYGGAAGPGKSWALVIDALGLQFQTTPLNCSAFEHPMYRAVIFRRKSTQLSKLIDECNKYYLPLGAKYKANGKGDPGASFNFPSGARIFLTHMENEKDKENHQGIEYQFAGFDELTQFTITQYIYIFSRLRSTITNLIPRMRATTNPTGAGLYWVKKRFIKNASFVMKPGRTYFFLPPKDIEDNPTGMYIHPDSTDFDQFVLDPMSQNKSPMAKSRTFIPGLLYENKILMENDPGYEFNIKMMGQKYERALLHGDWDAFGGDFFEDFDKEKMGVEPFVLHPEWRLFAGLDPGWSNPCAFTLYGVGPINPKIGHYPVIALFTYYEKGKSPEQHARDIKKRLTEFPYTRGRMPDMIVSGTDAFAKKERYTTSPNELTFSDQFMNEGLALEPAKTDRIIGWIAWKTIMRRGAWQYFKGYNDPLIDEIQSATHDEKKPEDILGGGNDPAVKDHALDENRYVCLAITDTLLSIPDKTPHWFTEEFTESRESQTTVMSS